MTDSTDNARRPDWEGFGRDLMENWPTGDIGGGELFEAALRNGLIREVPGGYDPEQHIDAEGICPETGDPWYEYAFGPTRANLTPDPLLSVKVKPLVWDGFRAGPYWIEVEADGIAHLFCDYDRTDEGVEPIKGGFLTLVSFDDLKAAAQADYEARIRSALEPDPQDARVRALVEALRAECDYWVKRADADLADQDANERIMDYPMPRKMTEAMRKADALVAALAAFDKGGKDE